LKQKQQKDERQQTTFPLVVSLFTCISWRPWSMQGLCSSKYYKDRQLQKW